MQSIAIGLANASTGVFRIVTPLYSKYHVHVLCVIVSVSDQASSDLGLRVCWI